MKKVIYIFLILHVGLLKAQYTLIPSHPFENYLISNDIDTEGLLDGRVLTTDIENVIELNLYALGIWLLNGLEDFASLEYLNCGYNELIDIDLSGNAELKTFLSEHDPNDDDYLLNYFPNIDFSNNTKLENIHINMAINNTLDLHFLPNLKTLNFSNNSLQVIDLRNGHNENITSFEALENGSLKCIYVDNKNAPFLSDWQIDNTTFFVETEAECESLSVINNELSVISIFPNPVTNYVSIQNVDIEKVLLFNVLGQKLKTYSTNKIDVAHLNKGVYYLNIETKDGQKIIKELVKN